MGTEYLHVKKPMLDDTGMHVKLAKIAAEEHADYATAIHTDAARSIPPESPEVISGNILDVIRQLLPVTRERDQVLEIVERVIADNETLRRQLAKLLLYGRKGAYRDTAKELPRSRRIRTRRVRCQQSSARQRAKRVFGQVYQQVGPDLVRLVDDVHSFGTARCSVVLGDVSLEPVAAG